MSRARLSYVFERYAIGEELISVPETEARLGVGRDRLGLLILQGHLAVVEAVKRHPAERPTRMLLRAEVTAMEDSPRKS